MSSPSSSVALLLQTDPLSHPKDQTCCGRPTGSDPPRKIPARSPGRCQEAWRLTSEGQSLEQIGIGLNTRVPNTPIICVTALGCLRVKYIYIYMCLGYINPSVLGWVRKITTLWNGNSTGRFMAVLKKIMFLCLYCTAACAQPNLSSFLATSGCSLLRTLLPILPGGLSGDSVYVIRVGCPWLLPHLA